MTILEPRRRAGGRLICGAAAPRRADPPSFPGRALPVVTFRGHYRQSPQSSRRELTVDPAITAAAVTAVIGAAGAVLAAWVQARTQRRPRRHCRRPGPAAAIVPGTRTAAAAGREPCRDDGRRPAARAGRALAARPPLPGSMMQVRAESIELYDAQYHRVVRFLMFNGASKADAQDAAHEAFIESWDLLAKDPDRWRAVTGKATWIRTVALRRYKRPPGSRRRPLTGGNEIPDLPAAGPGHDELTAQAQLVLRALQALDEEARAVMAFDMDDIPAADTAAALRITAQRVRDIKKRARAALKKELAGITAPGRRQS